MDLRISFGDSKEIFERNFINIKNLETKNIFLSKLRFWNISYFYSISLCTRCEFWISEFLKRIIHEQFSEKEVVSSSANKQNLPFIVSTFENKLRGKRDCWRSMNEIQGARIIFIGCYVIDVDYARMHVGRQDFDTRQGREIRKTRRMSREYRTWEM